VAETGIGEAHSSPLIFVAPRVLWLLSWTIPVLVVRSILAPLPLALPVARRDGRRARGAKDVEAFEDDGEVDLEGGLVLVAAVGSWCRVIGRRVGVASEELGLQEGVC
jgi:hypothetical protein